MLATLMKRALAICLALCLLPVMALADMDFTTPVTRSDFTASLFLDADAFPNDGAAHYEDWERFLSRL
ncbi:MAG: hypothetical protein IJ507_09205, partial [Clostridia bacterium]|nr:hypothetical protein [Clostridia bacterium]